MPGLGTDRRNRTVGNAEQSGQIGLWAAMVVVEAGRISARWTAAGVLYCVLECVAFGAELRSLRVEWRLTADRDGKTRSCRQLGCTTPSKDLSLTDLTSRGLLGFRDYVTNYTRSERFRSLRTKTEKLLADLSTVRYCLIIKGNRIQVRNYDSEIDYSADVEHTFEKFKQGAVKDYRVEFPASRQMNHIEAQILDLVAKLYPDVFAHLDKYCAKNAQCLDETIGVFDREIQFYIAYLEYVAIFKRAGLQFNYLHICDKDKHVYGREVFDVVLAYKLSSSGLPGQRIVVYRIRKT